MNATTSITIQEVIDQARQYLEQGISQDEAIRRAIAAAKA